MIDVGGSHVLSHDEWKEAVLARDQNRCVSCLGGGKVVVCYIVPPEAGGKPRVSNGATVCRDCRIAAEGTRVLPQKIDNKTPINFLISSKLHETVDKFVHNGSNFGSISALVRRMISSFITDPGLYEDIKQWQDEGSDVKVNGWVDGNQYGLFKMMCKERGLSYTDALKSLLLVAIDGYEAINN